MKINKEALKAKVNSLAKKLNVSHTTIYNRFFFDAFLTRLSSSQYKDKFILKGGLYLSSLLGINNRSTMDIDFCLKKIKMEKEEIVKIIKDVISIDINDGITFKYINIDDIRENDIYGGYQVVIQGRLNNVRHQFGIDVATGDPIIPKEKGYEYECLVTKEILSLKVYSLESIIAEKLETILSRGITNSRSKDYYDLYIIMKTQRNIINKEILKEAYKETCSYRNFFINENEALLLLEEVNKNTLMKTRWNAYCRNVKYSEGIEFNEVIDSIKESIKIAF